jgi:hypothetical protein
MREGRSSEGARAHELFRPRGRRHEGLGGRSLVPPGPQDPEKEVRARGHVLRDHAPGNRQEYEVHNLAEQDADDDDDDDDEKTTAAAAATSTIASTVRDEFISRLQALKSEQALFAFLGEFGCERIGDVLASDEQRARRLLESLERKKPEINPFS